MALFTDPQEVYGAFGRLLFDLVNDAEQMGRFQRTGNTVQWVLRRPDAMITVQTVPEVTPQIDLGPTRLRPDIVPDDGRRGRPRVLPGRAEPDGRPLPRSDQDPRLGREGPRAHPAAAARLRPLPRDRRGGRRGVPGVGGPAPRAPARRRGRRRPRRPRPRRGRPKRRRRPRSRRRRPRRPHPRPRSRAEESAAEEPAPEEPAEEPAAEESAPEESAPEESAPEEPASEESAPEEPAAAPDEPAAPPDEP